MASVAAEDKRGGRSSEPEGVRQRHGEARGPGPSRAIEVAFGVRLVEVDGGGDDLVLEREHRVDRLDRTRRVLAYELIVANGAVRNLIRESQLHQLENTLQTGRKDGMVLMDNCLYDLYCKCLITYDTALSRARHPDAIIRQKG